MKALIIEDDARLARFLGRMFNEEGWTSDMCQSGADALVQAQSGLYDLILLDWMLPELDGLSVCRELRRAAMTTPILMLSARGDVKERVLGLRTGADDYLVKPFEVEELLARMQALLRRSAGGAALRVGDLTIDPPSRSVSMAGTSLDLTAREYAFLLHLAHRPDQIVTRSELLFQVWDMSFDPGSNLIDVLVSRLRDKLGRHAWMIETARGRGYCLRTRKQDG